jgi:predicted ribosome quality control (RQC) complex YloA/Tae2 family protein
VEAFYFNDEADRKYDTLQKQILDELDRRESGILMTLSRLNDRLSDYGHMEQFRQYGDIITSRLHTIKKGDTLLSAENMFEEDTQIAIELKPELTPVENAEYYYRKYRKAKSGKDVLRREIRELEKSRETLLLLKADAEAAEDLADLERIESRIHGEKGAGIPPYAGKTGKKPGLSFTSGDFKILVGRSAGENDELLRKHVRGNDLWLHTRDFPGAYVFIKTIRGKTVPLDTLLDAGNLALFYSKGKASGKGDLYYTNVKYLKKPKDGKKGLVLPTQEKNLSIVLDMKRIGKLQGIERTGTPI